LEPWYRIKSSIEAEFKPAAMEPVRELELSLPFLVLLVLLLCFCVVLLCHGVDPLRVLRSSFKVPRRPRLSLSGSDGEREALLAVGRKARTSRTTIEVVR
jgi:hypothetical protein